jgi:release factor glutamine methyltransferase
VSLFGLKEGATVAEVLRTMAQAFALAGIESPEADARLLLGHALRLERAQLLSQSDRVLEAREITAAAALAARRLRHEPVARILGRKEFWSLTLAIDESVLVPRPETETVIEMALDFVARRGLRRGPWRILDIGTGSGALLLALLKELPEASGTGTDISGAALSVARSNAERSGLAARCRFIECNIAEKASGLFDLIVSNPPYIARHEIATLAREVRDFDPVLALDGGSDGLDFYRAISAQAPRILAPGGLIIVELGKGQESAVRTIMVNAGLAPGEARPDLAGVPRALAAGLAS